MYGENTKTTAIPIYRVLLYPVICVSIYLSFYIHKVNKNAPSLMSELCITRYGSTLYIGIA